MITYHVEVDHPHDGWVNLRDYHSVELAMRYALSWSENYSDQNPRQDVRVVRHCVDDTDSRQYCVHTVAVIHNGQSMPCMCKHQDMAAKAEDYPPCPTGWASVGS